MIQGKKFMSWLLSSLALTIMCSGVLFLVAGCRSTEDADDDGTPECAAEGEACEADADCCTGLLCSADGVCEPEVEPPECAEEGEACEADADCCEGLVCGADGLCELEGPGPDGAALYADNCAACHGDDGTGGMPIVGFTADDLTAGLESAVHGAITLTAEEIEAIAVFLGE